MWKISGRMNKEVAKEYLKINGYQLDKCYFYEGETPLHLVVEEEEIIHEANKSQVWKIGEWFYKDKIEVHINLYNYQY